MQLNSFLFQNTSDKEVVRLSLYTKEMNKRGFTKPSISLINKGEVKSARARLVAQGLTEAC